MTVSNKARIREFEDGVKVRAGGRGQRKRCYHTQTDCSWYPSRPVKVTTNDMAYHEYHHCQYCESLEQ